MFVFNPNKTLPRKVTSPLGIYTHLSGAEHSYLGWVNPLTGSIITHLKFNNSNIPLEKLCIKIGRMKRSHPPERQPEAAATEWVLNSSITKSTNQSFGASVSGNALVQEKLSRTWLWIRRGRTSAGTFFWWLISSRQRLLNFFTVTTSTHSFLIIYIANRMHVYGMTRRNRKDVYKMTLFRLEIVANLFLSPLLLLLLFQFIAKIDYSSRSRSRAVLSSYLGIISKGSLNLLRVEMCRRKVQRT